MDATDIRIIRTMGLQPYGREPRPASTLKASHIARALRMSREAVRDRVSRMEESGVIEGYEIFPNFRHMGLEPKSYYIKLGDHAAVDAVAEKLRAVEGIVGIYWFTEPDIVINILYRSVADLHRKLNLLMTLVGKSEITEFYEVHSAPVARPLSNLDWRILRALRGQALRPLSAVAAQLRVNPRTVKRRFERMGAEGDFYIIPLIDPSKVPGLLLFELLVWLGPEAEAGAFQSVARALDDNMVCWDGPMAPPMANFGIGLYGQRLGDIEVCRRKAAAVKGVARVRPLILQGSEERFEWLDEEMDARIKATAAPGRT